MGPAHLIRAARVLAATALLSAWVACGDIETTPGASNEATALEAAPPAFAIERYGIGASWYDYDGLSHVLTPRPVAYLFEWSERAPVLLTVESYYGVDGVSGRFTLTARAWGGASWESPEVIALAGNVKEAPVCLSFELGAEVGCDRGFDVALRTDLRVVPAAGFAVANPALYAAGHVLAGTDPPAITRVPGATIGAAPAPPDELRGAGRRLPSALQRVEDGVLGGTAPGQRNAWNSTWLLATADMRLAHVAFAELETSVQIDASCAPLGATAEEQQAPPPGAPPSLVVATTASSYEVHLVDLCAEGGPAVVATQDAPLDGLWSSAADFDVALEWSGSSWHPVLSPGVLAQASEVASVGEAVATPESFWDE